MAAVRARASVAALIVSFGLGLACSPSELDDECVAVDQDLGTSVHWCDGFFLPSFDTERTFEGKTAELSFPVCLPPAADSSCEVCPVDAVRAAVEDELAPVLDPLVPACQVEHWEIGCMRTIENAQQAGYESNYCCFEVAVWGPGCVEDNDGA